MNTSKTLSKHYLLVVFGLLVGLFLPLMIREWITVRSEGLHDAEWHTTAMAELLQRDLSHYQPITEVFSRLDDTEYFTDLDLHVRKKIGNLGLLQLKIYDSQGTVIYSNNRKQIGQKFIENTFFNKAMQGVVASEIITKKKYRQEYGLSSAVDLVEVSIPIRSEPDGSVKYVLEVYYDYTPIQERMNKLLISRTMSLFAIFVVVATLLAYLFRNKQILERKVEALESVLPICQHCKKIRVEAPGEPDAWHTVEAFFSKREMLKFSHGICGDCMSEHYPELNGRRQ